MPRIVFSPFKLHSLKPPAPAASGAVATVDYFDGAMPGFGLRISSTNARAWFLQTRLEGRVRRFTIGKAPREKDAPGLTLAKARTEAVRLAALVEGGQDPLELARVAKMAKAEAGNPRQDADTANRYQAVVTAYIEG